MPRRYAPAVLMPPRDWSGLTPSWLSEALAPAYPGVEVATVTLHGVADGTNARAAVAVTYRSGAGPARVFVKREGGWLNRLALTALGARDAEADLARSRVDLPLEHPRLYAAATDPRRLAAIVVMEDVTLRGAVPHAATRPLSIEEVCSGLDGLAALHARYWERPIPSFVRPWRLRATWAPVAWAGFVHAHHRLRALGHPELVVDTATAIERGFRGWAKVVAAGPQTMLHGDPHPGNTYRIPSGRIPSGTTGFYDWQLVRSGSWAHDVGYFVVSALSPEVRREHERDLLAGYLARLAALGIAAPAYGEARALYRRTPVFGLGSWLQTLAAGSFQPVDVCLATIERFAAAYVELTRRRTPPGAGR